MTYFDFFSSVFVSGLDQAVRTQEAKININCYIHERDIIFFFLKPEIERIFILLH